jgi:6-pyruvoyltetrahydropterin/6-carboxytetrahydropterin synthase
MTGVFEVGTTVEFEAFHLMPDAEGPEGSLHSHQYRVEAVAVRTSLDDRGMVVDLDVLTEAVRRVTQGLAAKDLQEVVRPSFEAGVTVEILAGWLHERLSAALTTTLSDRIAIRVWESSDSFGGYAGPPGAPPFT